MLLKFWRNSESLVGENLVYGGGSISPVGDSGGLNTQITKRSYVGNKKFAGFTVI